MIMNQLPAELRPTIQIIDDWFTNRRLGIAFEAKVLNGSLFVCSVDLENLIILFSPIKYSIVNIWRASLSKTENQSFT
jgi:hypothetical protein